MTTPSWPPSRHRGVIRSISPLDPGRTRASPKFVAELKKLGATEAVVAAAEGRPLPPTRRFNRAPYLAAATFQALLAIKNGVALGVHGVGEEAFYFCSLAAAVFVYLGVRRG